MHLLRFFQIALISYWVFLSSKNISFGNITYELSRHIIILEIYFINSTVENELIPISLNVSALNWHYQILFFRNTWVNTLLWSIQTVLAIKGGELCWNVTKQHLIYCILLPNILTFIVISSWMQFSGQAIHSEASTTKPKEATSKRI